MASIKTNIDFINKLLATKGISDIQRFTIMSLLKNELLEYVNAKEAEKPEKIEASKEEISFNAYHDPRVVQKYIIQFTLENEPVKFLTHPIDIPFTSFEGLMERVRDKDYFNYWRQIRYLDNDLWWKVIYPFIFQRHLNKDQNESDFSWGRYHIKIGWQYPDTLQKWCFEKFDDKSEHDQKMPSEMTIPKDLLPRDNNNKLLKPNGKSIKFFEDFIELFNCEIRFNDSELKVLLQKMSKELLPEHSVDLSNVPDILPKFYVSTRKVRKALKKILHMISVRTVSREVVVSCETLDEYVQLRITHLNSFPSEHADLISGGIKGSIASIVKELKHVCDFSIVTNYFDSEKRERFDYLYENMIDDYARRTLVQEEVNGFSFILTFLLPTNE